MKLIIISTFWNSGELTEKCINSLKNQYYTNFTAYFIDDMSIDDTYEIAEKTIGDDSRFILIKNTEKKYKTKNFVDIIRNNPKINWDDVIIELDGDDELSDNFVLGRLNKVFMNKDIWVCGTKWRDNKGVIGNYDKPKPHKARKDMWNFSHLRTFRAFLFRLIDDDDLKYEGQYFKAACDLGYGIPILEMCGDEHFHYIDEPLYIYNWHDKQSYSDKTDFKDSTLQWKTAKHIYGLTPYPQVMIKNDYESYDFIRETKQNKLQKVLPKDFNKKRIDYTKINKILPKKEIPKPIELQKQNKPKDRNELTRTRKGPITEQLFKMGNVRNKKKNLNSGIF